MDAPDDGCAVVRGIGEHALSLRDSGRCDRVAEHIGHCASRAEGMARER